MVALEITIAVISFILYAIFRNINKYLSYAYLFVIFIFAFIISNREFSTFYLILFLISVVLDGFSSAVNEGEPAQSFHEGKFTTKGFGMNLLFLGVGGIIYLIIAVLSKNAGGNIVGVPNLAITTPSDIGRVFKPTFEAMLGIIENFITFTIFDLLTAFGYLIPLLGFFFSVIPYVLPMLLSTFILAIFHITAYSVSVSLMIYAMFAFILFIGSKIIFKDSLPADTAHFINNLAVSIQRGLAIV